MRGNPAARGDEGEDTAASSDVRPDGMGGVSNTLMGRANQMRVEHTIVTADTVRASGVGRAPDHGHIVNGSLRASAGRHWDHENLAVVPIQDAQRSRVREQHGMGIGEPGDPMYTGGTRLDHGIVAFHTMQDPIHSEQRSPCLGTETGSIGVLVFDEQQITHPENRSRVAPGQPSPTLSLASRVDVIGQTRPRRLTPLEWERLQGFEPNYTNIDGATDSERYTALGNAMAVPVVRWIGKRLVAVEELINGKV